ncbi:helix-turn-helix domain-containing protein, partial [Micrococcus luteus]|uniref:helix-turn-helix domain-containing protein n=1 Tax=Micrococcus luteus TaxID=1270 RepID=UPI0035175BF8
MSNHTRCVRSNLAAEISRRDLTQARAAALAGLTPDGLSKRMSGQVEFRLGELLELARVLGVPFATLVAGIDAADEQLGSSPWKWCNRLRGCRGLVPVRSAGSASPPCSSRSLAPWSGAHG